MRGPGNPNPLTRDPRPETRNPTPETRNPKHETRNTKHETRTCTYARMCSCPQGLPMLLCDVRLPGKGNSNSHGARPVHLIITMTEWIRTSRLSMKNSLCPMLCNPGHPILKMRRFFSSSSLPSNCNPYPANCYPYPTAVRSELAVPAWCDRSESGILLPNNQLQHRTSHAPKDVLPLRICAKP